MATLSLSPVSEGTDLSAATINAVFNAFAAAATGLNALLETSVEREALDAQHLPSLSLSDVFTNGFTAIAPDDAATGTLDEYDNHLPLTSGPAFPYTYQTFISNDAWAPYGQTTVPGENGWAIVAFDAATNGSLYAAEVDIPTPDSLDDWGIEGVLARGSIGIRDVPAATALGTATVAIAIGFRDNSNNPYIIERSVRMYSGESVELGDAVTSTIIRQADLDATYSSGTADGNLKSIFLAIAGCEPGSGLTTNALDIETGYYNLTVLPLHAEEIT